MLGRSWRGRVVASAAVGAFLLTGSSAVGVSFAGAAVAGFGEEGSGAGQISVNPRGIAVEQESGDVYVVDTNNSRIDKFGPEGAFLLAWGWAVADGSTEALQSCTTTCFGGLEAPFRGSGTGQLSRAEGIAIDNSLSLSHGDVYVVDSANNRIQKFGPEGEFLLMFGGEVNATTSGNVCEAGEECKVGVAGGGPGFFKKLTGRSIAVDAAGSVHVGDENRVQQFSPTGALEGEVTLPGAGLVENLTLDSTGDLYIKSSALAGVRKYNAGGTEIPKPRDEAGAPERGAIAIGPGDRLFVNHFVGERHHILAYDAAGNQLSSFDAGGEAEDGKRGIAYGETIKAIYILNAGTVRIVPPPAPGPLVLAGSESASEVQPTTAVLGASVNPEGALTEYHFEYGTTTGYGQETPSASLETVDELQTLTLEATAGNYLLRFKGQVSAEIPFNATAAEVQADLEAIAAIGAGNVSVSGAEGGPYAIEFIAALGAFDQPQLAVEPISLENGTKAGTATVATTRPGISFFDDRSVSAAIESLQVSTTYHFRVVATNAAETTLGPDQSFTTLPPVSIDATSASEVNDTSARLGVELNPHGLLTEYRFEYDTTPYAEGGAAHGIKVPVPDGSAGSGTTDVIRSEPIQGLTPSTTYHFRVVAHNSLGTVESPDRSFRTQHSVASGLPDGRAFELVSPPNKHGAPLEPITEEGGIIQAAAHGGGFAYVALGPVGGDPAGVRSPDESQLLATRGAGGWSSRDITTPHEEIAIIRVGFPSEYKFFSESLTAGIVEPQGATPLAPNDPTNTERTPYRREANGEYAPLVNSANVPPGTKFGGEELPGTGSYSNGAEFRAATPDLSHVLLLSPQVLSSGFEAGFVPAEPPTPNLYELAGGSLRLVSVLPSGEGGKAAAEAGLPARVGDNELDMRGAISTDGERVVFETGQPARHLYVRDVGLAQTVRLDERQAGAAGGPGAAIFQGASADGGKIFFTDASRLTKDASAKADKPDLYMCEVTASAGPLSCALSDLSVGVNTGEAANVAAKVSAIDKAGRHVYFAASGVLTNSANARGEHAVAGNCEVAGDAPCNLYVYDTDAHQVSLVAVLSSNDAPDWAGHGNQHVLGNLTARVSPSGRYLTFMSQRSLSGYDNRDARNGEADEEVFLYDASAGAVRCVSCNPTGARPRGVFDTDLFPGLLVDHPQSWPKRWLAASIPGWTLQWLNLALYQSRYLSDSGRMFFNAADGLVPLDTNGVEDVYQYEPTDIGSCRESSETFSEATGGCIALISSGESKEESAFLDASENGDEVFFLTASRLTSTDVDSAFDVYDAHVCSSSSPCPPPPPPSPPACEGDACQNPVAPPNDATPGSLSFHGPGNAVPAPAPVVKPTPPLTRAQKLARALKACKKDKPKKRRVACEKQARKKYGPKTKAHAKKAGHGRRGK